MECPACGYLMQPYEKDCPRCQDMAKRGLSITPISASASYIPPAPVTTPPINTGYECGYCGHGISPHAHTCPGCGHPFVREPSPRWLVTITMWTFTLIAILAIMGAGGAGIPFALCVDIPALLFAFVLASSPNQSDRSNGKAKLFLEIIGFVLAFLASAHR